MMSAIKDMIKSNIISLNNIIGNITRAVSEKRMSDKEKEQAAVDIESIKNKIKSLEKELSKEDFSTESRINFKDSEERRLRELSEVSNEPQPEPELREYDICTQVGGGDVLPGGDEDCVICGDPLKDQPICKSQDCNHWYHGSCLKQYMRTKPNKGNIPCPICKKIIPIDYLITNTLTNFGKRKFVDQLS